MPDIQGKTPSPFHINVEQQKKRAKELCRDLRRGDEQAVGRFRRHHPKAAGLSSDEIVAALPRLADAQLVIARELGAASWARLKTHAAALATAGAAIRKNETPPDADLKTLHIRCGSDLQTTLPAAGFAGALLEYANPFCQGPVVDGPEFLLRRAEFLSRAYGLQPVRETLAGLRREENALAAAAAQYDRVVLWFEHDSYDQLILGRILAHFAENGTPGCLELVDLAEFPGSARFIGLGQLPPEAMRMLWDGRKPVTPDKLTQGREAWDALRAPDPAGLAAIASAPDCALPNLPRAVRRHLRELPSSQTGLGLTEQLILEILSEGDRTAGQIFRGLMREKEPLPWLGDLMFWFILRSMGRISAPVFDILSQNGYPGTPEDPLAGDCDWASPLPPRILSLTDTGRRVLEGSIDFLSLHPLERWLGGIRLDPRQPCWRWDAKRERPMLV